MAMCNTGEDGHVYVITFTARRGWPSVTQATMAMCTLQRRTLRANECMQAGKHGYCRDGALETGREGPG